MDFPGQIHTCLYRTGRPCAKGSFVHMGLPVARPFKRRGQLEIVKTGTYTYQSSRVDIKDGALFLASTGDPAVHDKPPSASSCDPALFFRTLCGVRKGSLPSQRSRLDANSQSTTADATFQLDRSEIDCLVVSPNYDSVRKASKLSFHGRFYAIRSTLNTFIEMCITLCCL